MLITKLKTYPKHSQTGGYGGGSTSTGSIQTNLYTSGGEYQLADGTEYIGDYHIHPIQGAMVGATHPRSPHPALFPYGGVAPTPPTTLAMGHSQDPGAISLPNQQTQQTVAPYVPTTQELLEYEKYIVSGSTYKSNLKFLNDRDTKGNISLLEGADNSNLLFESVTNNYSNRSVIASIDTQFQFFKFPAQVTTEIDDIEFDESLLDIDIQSAISNDPYQGKLIVSAATGISGEKFFVQGLVKRKFFIKADSTWALKNNLPPFANIEGTIPGLNNGEDNSGNWNGSTVIQVPASVFDGYDIGPDYTPEDAFSEGNVYGKISIRATSTIISSSIGTQKNLIINGPHFGFITFSDVASKLGEFRFAEFAVKDLSKSYMGISSDNFGNDTNNLLSDYDILGDALGPYASFYEEQTLSPGTLSNTGGTSDYNQTAKRLLELIRDGLLQFTEVERKPLNPAAVDSTTSATNYITPHGSRFIIQLNATGSDFLAGNTYNLNPSNTVTTAAVPYVQDFVGLNGESINTIGNAEGEYIWYKGQLRVEIEGSGFQLLHGPNENNITSFLRDRDNNQLDPTGGTAVAPLQCPAKPGDDYRGWILNFEDIYTADNGYPDGFIPNTSDNFRVNYTSGAGDFDFDIDVYFIGFKDVNTDGSDKNYYIVQDSIHFNQPNFAQSTMPLGPGAP